MENDPNLCKRVNVSRSELPAITHIDNSARVQTVTAEEKWQILSIDQRIL